MPIFGRKLRSATSPAHSAEASAAAVDDFWAWWVATGAHQCAAAIADKQPEAMVTELSSRIAGVHPDLAWELGPGSTAEHVLVVTAEGNAELRGAARRWLRKAPTPDPTWQYADSRQAMGDVSGVVLTLDGTDLPLGEVEVAASRSGIRLDVLLHHPALAGVPEPGRVRIGFIALDSALGEAVVETWIGRIDVSTNAVEGSVPLPRLGDLVAELKAELLDDGRPAWRILEGQGPSGPVLVTAMIPLCATVAPQLDVHTRVTVPYAGRLETGYPDEHSLPQLRAFEDHLTDRLGGTGMLVAHESAAGVRTLHYYVDSTTPAVDVLRAAVGGWSEGAVAVTSERDPEWRAVRAFG